MPPRPRRTARLAAVALITALAAAVAASPAAAGSQSSNSSSNCSNGHCTRVESYETERGGFRQGWTRVDRWDERRNRDGRRWPGYERRYYDGPYREHRPPRRHRRDRDDD